MIAELLARALAVVLEQASSVVSVMSAAGIPDPGPPKPPPGAERILDVLAWAKWLGLAIAVLGITVVGIRMVIAHRSGQGAGHLGSLGWVVAGTILIASAVSIVGFLAGA